ncbi:DNA-binding protein D-ETS-4 [Halotydeus destructor]|nr:DNA-binding protein D-ETS-4 [Halotydeus destructor]
MPYIESQPQVLVNNQQSVAMYGDTGHQHHHHASMTTMASGQQLNSALEAELQNILLDQCAREISQTCDALVISADPFNWSVPNVRSWFLWQINQFNLSQVRLEYFQMDGISLCNMSEAEFKQRVDGQSGDILYAQLEIWKTAANMAPQTYGQFKGFRSDQAYMMDQSMDMCGLLNNNNNQWSNNMTPVDHVHVPQGLAETTGCPRAVIKQEPIDTSIVKMESCLSPAMSSCASPHSSIGLSSAFASDRSVTEASLVTSDYGSEGTQSDDEISDDGCEVSSLSPSLGSPPAPGNGGPRTTSSHIHLWQFLKELLGQAQQYGSCIRWLDRSTGVFKIEDSVRVARLWGKRKNRPAMNYDKLSRSIRQYYKKGIMKKTERSQRLVYQFCHPYCL